MCHKLMYLKTYSWKTDFYETNADGVANDPLHDYSIEYTLVLNLPI
jgi:hypothetical protein